MTNQPIVIDDTDLENVNGAGLLLPAVQKIREAAARSSAGDVDGDGRADIIVGTGAGGGPHIR